MNYLDIIGINYYPTISDKHMSEGTINISEMYDRLQEPSDSQNVFDVFYNIASRFQKDIFVTECGTMPYDDALITCISPYLNNASLKRYDGQALFYRITAIGLSRLSYVSGYCVWHVSYPFDFINDDFETESFVELRNLFNEVIK